MAELSSTAKKYEEAYNLQYSELFHNDTLRTSHVLVIDLIVNIERTNLQDEAHIASQTVSIIVMSNILLENM